MWERDSGPPNSGPRGQSEVKQNHRHRTVLYLEFTTAGVYYFLRIKQKSKVDGRLMVYCPASPQKTLVIVMGQRKGENAG
ncbi:hypothetical protein OUZ56_019541 [Daphnia magna]|uniref:Uncharacterized protein n=1 Tax=Daphnia magna TaxID=35525 RepID=A0ABQ9ZBY3_9CRUS|nr:hypothetical protein OUZ56_019541 [Daphnia magna]